MIKNKKFNFIIPVYNEAQNIESTIIFIKKNFFSDDYLISFIDDNSPDGTASKVLSLKNKYPEVELIQHGKKEGLGAAILFGYINSKSDYLIGLDADLSQSPKYLHQMYKLLKTDADMVIGSRYVSGGKVVGKNQIRLIGSITMNKIASKLLNIDVLDISHTFRIFKREIIIKISNLLKEKGHPSFLVEFTYYAKKNRFKIKEYPISFIERSSDRGVSKLSASKEIIPFFKTVFKLINK